MSTIVLRSVKGSALTFTEGDANFSNLNTDKLEDITNESIGDLSDVDISSNTNGYVLTYNSTSGNLELQAASGGISNVVEDTTPQLGGNLDVNGNSIVSVSNGNIAITPNGTGQLQASKLQYSEDIHDLGTTGGTITPDVADGNVQTITLNNNLTINGFSSAVAGQSLTLIIDTNGTGRTLSSTMKFAGGAKTLSSTDTIDIMTVFYDGTNYYANLVTNFS